MRIEDVAQICHEANRTYCVLLGDETHGSWAYAPQWQRNSALAGVRYHLTHPESTPADSHEEWYQNKLRDGWVYGPFKDAQKKEHPCMVAFEQLPPEQQAKDKLFVAIVRALEHLIERNGGR